jgi:hypothetical protein
VQASSDEDSPESNQQGRLGGGVYFAPTFMLYGTCHEWFKKPGSMLPGDPYWFIGEGDQGYRYGAFTPGFGAVGEYDLLPRLTMGLEVFVAFPEITYIEDASTTGLEPCDECQRDLMMSLLLRVKVPFTVGRVVSLYPLMASGFHFYAGKSNWTNLDGKYLVGLALVGGMGASFKVHRVITLFLEARYNLGVTWDKGSKGNASYSDRLLTHGLSIPVGVRFP